MKIITRSFYVFTIILFAGMIYVHKFDTSFAVKNSQKNIELGKKLYDQKNVAYVMVMTEATLLQKTILGLIGSQSSTSLLKLKTFSLGIVLME